MRRGLGPDEYGDEYYPIGVIYRQHKHRESRWWIRFVSPEHIAGAPSCEIDRDLEVLSEAEEICREETTNR